MSLALDKIAEIKRLRKEGFGYKQIAKRVEVSGSSARNHSIGVAQEKTRSVRNNCDALYERKNVKCQRPPAHRGIHLSDETGKLIYWE